MIDHFPPPKLWAPSKLAIIRAASLGEIERTAPVLGSFLPGMAPGRFAASPRPVSIAFFASATSTGQTIVAPAGILRGDILVLNDRALNATGLPSFLFPSGFSFFAGANDGSVLAQSASWKLANGSEAGATLTGMNGTSQNRKVLLVFRPNVPANSLSVGPTSVATISDINPGAQTIVATGGTAPLVVIGFYGSSGTIDPRTFTVGGSAAKDGEASEGNNLYAAYKIYNSVPADVVVDMDDEGTDNVVCGNWIAAA